MKKVIIIGCPGSGKTTFARELAHTVNLPLTHLDTLYHDSRFNYYTDKAAWHKQLEVLLSQPSWIIEGNYKDTYELRFAPADTIIFLNYPRYLCLWRTLKRNLQYRHKLREEMPDNWEEKVSLGFIKFIWGFRNKEVPKLQSLLAKHPDKIVVTLLNPSESKAYLRGLGS